ncbi:MAG TPA: primosomal protein DnaI, partial [Bacilli bacterium]|nr:primosomal protein DnaI [Bacilli bacterium]
VLQYRMDNDLPVFMTSNLNFNELSKHFSETNNELDDMKGRRIIERIKYLMKPFEIKGENYRSDEWK